MSAGNPDKGLTTQDLKTLAAPFPEDRIGVKVQSFSKDKTKAMLVCYVQHTDAYHRLDQVDPNWTAEITESNRAGDTVFASVRLTLKGVSRENFGDGGDPKSATSDAIKRAAMLFGVGRYLYDSETVWVDYNDQRDKFKSWTIQEFNDAAGRQRKAKTPVGKKEMPEAEPAPPPKTTPKSTREDLNRILMNLYRPYLTSFPATQFDQLLKSRYQVQETRLMTVEQLEDLTNYMQARMATVGGGGGDSRAADPKPGREPGQDDDEKAIDAVAEAEERARLQKAVSERAKELKLKGKDIVKMTQEIYKLPPGELALAQLAEFLNKHLKNGGKKK
jgi:hypothetical protein